MIREGHEFDRGQDLNLTADAVVVGSGAGGPVIAKELQERGHQVVMLEEGGHYRTADFKNDPVWAFAHLYRDGGATIALGSPPVPFPLGRCLGGTTTVNSGTCFRTPDVILRRWERAWNLPDISPEAMKPHFERVESLFSVRPVHPGNMGRNGELFLDAARGLGYSAGPLNRNMNDKCVGCGTCTLGCPTGGKRPTLLNYIPEASRLGAQVYCDFRVEKVHARMGAATGVSGSILDRETKKRRARFRVNAKVVVLAAGAIGTPLLLQRSRLANSSGQVGRNLRLHPGIRVYALMDEVVNGWRGVPQGVYVDEFWNEGVMLEGIFVGPLLSAPALPYFGRRNKELMWSFPRVAAFGAMVQDETRGRVRPGPFGFPLITYRLEKEDLRKAVRAIGYTAEIFFAAGAKKVFPTIPWLPEINDRRQIAEILTGPVKPSDLEMMAFHPMGTCRMGTRPDRSVTDPWGETFDVRNLFVADASLFPSCLGVNPMESIMAFANRNAEHIHAHKL